MIHDDPSSQPESESVFPADCHFKIICHCQDGIGERIETTLSELQVTEAVEVGNQSSGGRYITFNVTIHITHRERMQEIDAALRNIEGVRMVL